MISSGQRFVSLALGITIGTSKSWGDYVAALRISFFLDCNARLNGNDCIFGKIFFVLNLASVLVH